MTHQHFKRCMVELLQAAQGYYSEAGRLIECSAHQTMQEDLIPEDISDHIQHFEVTGQTGSVKLKRDDFPEYAFVLTRLAQPGRYWELIAFENDQQFRHVIHTVPIGLMRIGNGWQCTYVNQFLLDTLGIERDELVDRGWIGIFEPDFSESLFRYVAERQYTIRPFTLDTCVVTALGRKVYVSIQAVVYVRSDHDIDQVTIAIMNRNEAVRAQLGLEFIANHDPLTRLLNRQAFMTRAQAINSEANQGTAICFIDVNRFKQINDVYGHGAGDQILKIIASRLKSIARPTDLLARLGGDEFILLLTGIRKAATVDKIARKIADAVNGDATVSGKIIDISCSIGVAHGSQLQELSLPGDDPHPALDQLIEAADLAMYAAKKNRRGSFQIFNTHLKTNLTRETCALEEFEQVVDQECFTTLFQPIFNRNKQIVAIEALTRATQEMSYHNSIEDIIRTSAKSNLQARFHELITQKSLEEFAKLECHSIRLNLNIEISQMHSSQIVEWVLQHCERLGIPVEALCIEITERFLTARDAQLEKNLETFVSKGASISMDDFGTGHSSIKRLLSHNFTQLKIDKYFVDAAKECQSKALALSAMIALGKSMRLEVLAEGIECHQTYERCLLSGADLYQGYYLARPMPIQSMSKLISEIDRDRRTIQ